MSDSLFARHGREFSPGEVLFREGDEGGEMYVIQSGRVRISRASATGERTLSVLGEGDFFGEMAILNDRPRTATATALTAGRGLQIDARMFESMVLGNPEISMRLVKKLARRLEGANAFIDILLQQDPRLRVILGMARAADEFGVARNDALFVPTTPSELSQEVGLAERDVRAVMQRLARVGIIAPSTDDGWTVEDPARLHELLSFVEKQHSVGGRSARSAREGV